MSIVNDTIFDNFLFTPDEISVLADPHSNNISEALCEKYLPTITQTPIALGKAGIALWILGFIITFVLMVLFAKQGYFIYKTAHKLFRNNLHSITSMYVVMALFTSIGTGIPRAHSACSAAKDIYMSIGISNFVDLTVAMYGGENIMARCVEDKVINLRVIPLCKCCFCIPRCKPLRISITILKWLVWQMKWSQALYYLAKLVSQKALENSIGISAPNQVSFWVLHILNVISFLSGVFSLVIIESLVIQDLQQKYNYGVKMKLIRFTILTTKLQRLLFEILEVTDVYPCIPPLVSKKFYKNVLKDFIYLVELLVLGILTFFVYNKRGEFVPENPNVVSQLIKERQVGQDVENGNCIESNSPMILKNDQNL